MSMDQFEDDADPTQVKWEIDPANLTEEFCRAPALLAYLNQQYADAVRERLLAEFALENVEAQLTVELRASDAKMTVHELKARMLTRESYITARKRLIHYEHETRVVRGKCEATEAKLRMLQMVGGKVRSELEREPAVRVPRRPGEDF